MATSWKECSILMREVSVDELNEGDLFWVQTPRDEKDCAGALMYFGGNGFVYNTNGVSFRQSAFNGCKFFVLAIDDIKPEIARSIARVKEILDKSK